MALACLIFCYLDIQNKKYNRTAKEANYHQKQLYKLIFEVPCLCNSSISSYYETYVHLRAISFYYILLGLYNGEQKCTSNYNYYFGHLINTTYEISERFSSGGF